MSRRCFGVCSLEVWGKEVLDVPFSLFLLQPRLSIYQEESLVEDEKSQTIKCCPDPHGQAPPAHRRQSIPVCGPHTEPSPIGMTSSVSSPGLLTVRYSDLGKGDSAGAAGQLGPGLLAQRGPGVLSLAWRSQPPWEKCRRALEAREETAESNFQGICRTDTNGYIRSSVAILQARAMCCPSGPLGQSSVVAGERKLVPKKKSGASGGLREFHIV